MSSPCTAADRRCGVGCVGADLMPMAIRAVVGSLGAAAWHRSMAQRGDERGADRCARRAGRRERGGGRGVRARVVGCLRYGRRRRHHHRRRGDVQRPLVDVRSPRATRAPPTSNGRIKGGRGVVAACVLSRVVGDGHAIRRTEGMRHNRTRRAGGGGCGRSCACARRGAVAM